VASLYKKRYPDMLHKMPFQFDRPLFVKIAFTAAGKDWGIQQEFPWKEMSMDSDKIQTLYNNGYLYHNEKMEVERRVGDGLEVLDIEALRILVDQINEKVKKHSRTTVEYNTRKCRKSAVPDKQRGLIRSWRRNYGHLESL